MANKVVTSKEYQKIHNRQPDEFLTKVSSFWRLPGRSPGSCEESPVDVVAGTGQGLPAA
jgi:hypothetical protein